MFPDPKLALVTLYSIKCVVTAFKGHYGCLILTFTPRASPEMTATVTPSLLGLGTCLFFSSWYWGSTILSAFRRFTQSWRPRIGSSDRGISAWTTPRPAVIHCQHTHTHIHFNRLEKRFNFRTRSWVALRLNWFEFVWPGPKKHKPLFTEYHKALSCGRFYSLFSPILDLSFIVGDICLRNNRFDCLGEEK